MTCKNDCLHYNVCYYHIDEETPFSVTECNNFKNKTDFVEVVRCGKCKHTLTHTCAITGTKTLVCVYGTKPLAVLPTHFCGYGERRDS